MDSAVSVEQVNALQVVMCGSLCLQLSGGCELTVVLQDFTAGGSTELSISTGETRSHLPPRHQFPVTLK